MKNPQQTFYSALKTESFPSKIRGQTGLPALTSRSTLDGRFQPERLGKKEQLKAICTGKEGVKLSLFTVDMTLHMENPKESTHTKAKRANKQMFQATRPAHKNQLCFYTPAVDNPEKKRRKRSHSGKLSERRRTGHRKGLRAPWSGDISLLMGLGGGACISEHLEFFVCVSASLTRIKESKQVWWGWWSVQEKRNHSRRQARVTWGSAFLPPFTSQEPQEAGEQNPRPPGGNQAWVSLPRRGREQTRPRKLFT